ncbi:hypothetical protein B0E55_05262 [Rhodococcus sp. 66b]|nr:hypothetical protein B0E55_05262 [Rhodococcus sp. 66b]
MVLSRRHHPARTPKVAALASPWLRFYRPRMDTTKPGPYLHHSNSQPASTWKYLSTTMPRVRSVMRRCDENASARTGSASPHTDPHRITGATPRLEHSHCETRHRPAAKSSHVPDRGRPMPRPRSNPHKVGAGYLPRSGIHRRPLYLKPISPRLLPLSRCLGHRRRPPDRPPSRRSAGHCAYSDRGLAHHGTATPKCLAVRQRCTPAFSKMSSQLRYGWPTCQCRGPLVASTEPLTTSTSHCPLSASSPGG